MNLNDLTPPVTAAVINEQIKRQFGKDYKVTALNLTESIKLLNKTNDMVVKFKLRENLHTSHNNSTYMKLIMLSEAAFKHVSDLTQTKGQDMNKSYTAALKIAAMGGKLSEAQIKSLRVSPAMSAVLESKEKAQKFMRTIVESKRAKKALNESEIATAQTTLAAQDIADQIQSMIEKFADIRFKELPALQDSIRNSQGVEAAESFNSVVLQSLEQLTGALESSKGEVNNAVSALNGEEMPMGGDLDLDSMDGDDELDMDMDFDDEEDGMGVDGDMGMGDEDGDFDMDLEDDDDDMVDLGRSRR